MSEQHTPTRFVASPTDCLQVSSLCAQLAYGTQSYLKISAC